jgi:uncharacterized membrane protein YedE/YeeE
VIYDPYALSFSLAGGMLIGVAAVLLLALHGRVLGVSGIVNGVLDRKHGDRDWRGALLVGVVLGALLWTLAMPAAPAPRTGFPGWALALGGLLVGFGTRVGSGCTSGHGVCGISRLSARSLVATATFIASGVVTLYLMRHALAVLP